MMAHQVKAPEEFVRGGRMVVLLTLGEAEALYDVVRELRGANASLDRARRVLGNQIRWLKGRHDGD